MTIITTRRAVLLGAAAIMPAARAARAADPASELARIERETGGRMGVAILDTATGGRLLHRGDERFPMCSTFKVLASGAVLARVDAGQESLDRRIRFAASDVVTYSPVTKSQAGGAGMTLGAICEAAITQSDNTAGNLILASIGGPPAVTAFARELDDPVTRLDRTETTLNEATPGDPRDTTTPAAMAADLQKLVLGDVLSPASRAQLASWMSATKTGDAKLRAGVPKNWQVGDKTGGGDHGAMADIAVLWRPGRAPLVVTVYITETEASFDQRNACIAAIGRMVAAMM